MPRPGAPTPSRRAPLTRARALATAVELADAGGIDELTMRKLAQALGVEAMSLYHHISSKSDILDGMVDLVFGAIELPADGTDWATAMQVRAHSLRAALLRHPWAIGIMESRRSPGPATLRHHDAVIRCCRQAGFSVEMAAHAFSALDSYIYGFVLQEINLPFVDGDDLAEVLDTIMPDDFAAQYPHLAELTAEYVRRPGYSYGNEFAFGLEMIIDGLERAARGDRSAPRLGPSRSSSEADDESHDVPLLVGPVVDVIHRATTDPPTPPPVGAGGRQGVTHRAGRPGPGVANRHDHSTLMGQPRVDGDGAASMDDRIGDDLAHREFES